jgi:urea transporter
MNELNILALRAPRPPVTSVPLIFWRSAPTIAGFHQWITLLIKSHRLIGGVVIGAKLAGVAPHAIGTMWETIKQGFFMPYWLITMKTIHRFMG